MTETMRALLRYSKKESTSSNWKDIREEVLGELYHYDMDVIDVFTVIYTVMEAVAQEPKFETRLNPLRIMTAPSRGWVAVRKDSMEEFYGAMIRHMMGELRMTRVDWCRNQLFPFEGYADV